MSLFNRQFHGTNRISSSKSVFRKRLTSVRLKKGFNLKNGSVFSFNPEQRKNIIFKGEKKDNQFNFDMVLKKASYGKKEKDIWGVEKYQNNEYLRYLSQKKEFNEEDYIEKIKSEIEIKFRQSKLNPSRESAKTNSVLSRSVGPRPSDAKESLPRRRIDSQIFKKNQDFLAKKKIDIVQIYEDQLNNKNNEIDNYIESMRIKKKDLNLNKFFKKSKKGLFLCELQGNRDLPKKFKKLFGCEIHGSRSHNVIYKDSKQVRNLKSKQKKFYQMVDKQAEWIMFERMKKNEKIQRENERNIKSKLKIIRDLKKYSIAD